MQTYTHKHIHIQVLQMVFCPAGRSLRLCLCDESTITHVTIEGSVLPFGAGSLNLSDLTTINNARALVSHALAKGGTGRGSLQGLMELLLREGKTDGSVLDSDKLMWVPCTFEETDEHLPKIIPDKNMGCVCVYTDLLACVRVSPDVDAIPV
jgi:hypothetical protein